MRVPFVTEQTGEVLVEIRVLDDLAALDARGEVPVPMTEITSLAFLHLGVDVARRQRLAVVALLAEGQDRQAPPEEVRVVLDRRAAFRIVAGHAGDLPLARE